MARNTFKREMTVDEIESSLLNALAILTNKGLAEALGNDESTISRWKERGYFREVARVLYALNKKVVDQDEVTAKVPHLEMMFDYVEIGLEATRSEVLGK